MPRTGVKKEPAIRDRVIEFKRVNRDDVLPNEHNWRKHPEPQRAALRGLIQEIGVAGAGLAYYSERNGGKLCLIDGHLRREEIPEQLPVIITDLNDVEADKLLASYDPLAAMAQADKVQLDALLHEVSTGDAALSQMLSDLAAESGLSYGTQEPATAPAPSPEPQFDLADQLQKRWGTKRGQVWTISGHRLMCGDSTDAGDVEKLMRGQSAVLCFTSPPYGQQREYQKSISDWDDLMNGVFAILPMTDDGQVLVNLGLIHRDGEWVEYWRDWLSWMRTRGWRSFGWYVWDQGNGMMGDWNGRFAPSHEFIFHFNKESKQPRKFIPTKAVSIDRAEAKRRGAAEGKKQQALRNPDGSVSAIRSLDKYGQAFKIPDSVIRIYREHARGIHTQVHPAVFPDELPSHFMKAFSSEGKICYEPFNGSGSSIVAAEQTKRKCYAMDIEPSYVAVTLQRLADMGMKPMPADRVTQQTYVVHSSAVPVHG
jgi:DNA modification methylase